MSIRMMCEKRHDKGEEDIFRPVVVCDVCGKEIATATGGNAYYYPDFSGGQEAFYAARFEIKTTHKRCRLPDDIGMGLPADESRHYFWCELSDLIVHMARNLDFVQPLIKRLEDGGR